MTESALHTDRAVTIRARPNDRAKSYLGASISAKFQAIMMAVQSSRFPCLRA
jgi:hypothetical protein